MFAGIIGQDRAAGRTRGHRRVLAACAGLPLAIRIAGARLAARSNWTVRTMATPAVRRTAAAGLVEDRRPGRPGLLRGELQAACPSRSADGVDPAHAFRLLGLWQGPSIGLPAAAALIGQPEDAVADALEVLVDAQLLQAPAPDRYRFHDLLKAYAADRAMAEEPQAARDDAVRRVLAWYLHTVGCRRAPGVALPRTRCRWPRAQPGVPPLTFSTPSRR